MVRRPVRSTSARSRFECQSRRSEPRGGPAGLAPPGRRKLPSAERASRPRGWASRFFWRPDLEGVTKAHSVPILASDATCSAAGLNAEGWLVGRRDALVGRHEAMPYFTPTPARLWPHFGEDAARDGDRGEWTGSPRRSHAPPPRRPERAPRQPWQRGRDGRRPRYSSARQAVTSGSLADGSSTPPGCRELTEWSPRPTDHRSSARPTRGSRDRGAAGSFSPRRPPPARSPACGRAARRRPCRTGP